MKHYFKTLQLILAGMACILSSCKSETQNQGEESEIKSTKPNIVIIYLDDLGFGDLGAYGATQLQTPNMDRLAEEGVRFTNGYATSATCTPSRYALLTGVYPWRNDEARILAGTARMIIDTNQITIPKMLKAEGYKTGIVGKWHLGLGDGTLDWNEHISPGTNEVGFDYSYIMAATQDRVPTVYIKNGDVENLDPSDPIRVNYNKNFEGEPTAISNPELLKMTWHHGHNNSIVNGIPRIGFMKGGKSALWSDIDMADNFLTKAQNYIKENKNGPFFLYYALQQPHVPRTPNPRFVGKSGMGPRGDAIVEADWCIGQFMKTLEAEGVLENTLVILSSDNGPVLNDGYNDRAVELLGDHKPAGPLRGGKYSLYDAGTHVPFITYWKGTIQPNVSDALVCQIDLLSSIAALVGSKQTAEDSKNLIEVFMGKSDSGREQLVLEASSKTSFRKGDWVLIPPYQGPVVNQSVNIEMGNSKDYQLYNLKEDAGQQNNLATANPQKLDEMIADFKSVRGNSDENIKELELK